MRTALIEERDGEIGIGNFKRNGMAWEVEYYEDRKRVDLTVHRDHAKAVEYATAWIEDGILMGDYR